MNMINRRSLLCALSALPFIPGEILRPTSAPVRMTFATVGFSDEVIQYILRAIREASDDRDVIILPENWPQQ